jgi:uncharacterized membrane protein
MSSHDDFCASEAAEITRKRAALAALLLSTLPLLLTTAAVTAPLAVPHHPWIGLALHGIFSRICEQDPARSFKIFGLPMAICVRCFGIYIGLAAGAASGPLLRIHRWMALRILCIALLLSLADAAAEVMHLHGNIALLRLLLGLAVGMAAGFTMTGSGSLERRLDD